VAGIVWTQVTDAAVLAQRGEVEAGKAALEQCWAATTPDDHAVRCVVAHYLADLQDNVDDEITWDERALAELPHLRDEDVAGLGVSSVAGFGPSLHLNLGDGYLRRGERDRARDHLKQGRAALGTLGDDPYGVMIRRGFERLARRVDASDGSLPRRR